MSQSDFIKLAAELAETGRDQGGVGAGAVLAKGDELVSSSHDKTRQLGDPIALAEMDCIRQAGRRNDQAELTLYSTHYPNMLVAGTIVQFSIGSLVIGQPQSTNAAIEFLQGKNGPVVFAPSAQCADLIN